MAVRIVKREYKEVFSSDTTNWLLGNVGDLQEAIFDIESDLSFIGSQSNPLQIDYTLNAFINLSGQSWGSLGFDDGMTIEFIYDLFVDTNGDGNFDQVTTVSNDYTIETIQNDQMFVNEPIQADDFDMIPINFGTKKVGNVIIRAADAIQGVDITYGHITNEDYDTETLNSVIDGSQTKFTLENINAVPVGTFQFMEANGIQSGMSIRTCKFRKVDGFSGGDNELLKYDTIEKDFRFDSESVSGDDNDFDYITIPIQTPATGDYKTVLNARDISLSSSGIPSVIEDDCFLYDASTGYSQDLLFDFVFRIVGTNETDDNDIVSVSVLRFSGGSNLVFAEEINVQSWFDARSLLGKELDINKIQNIQVNQGDSFVIVFKYKAPENNYIDISLGSGDISVSKKDTTFTPEGKQFFQVCIQYIISSFYDSVDNFENLQQPAFLVGDGSLTDNMKINLYPIWNNPNVLIKNDLQETKRLGNTGWFNENFNELDNDFNVESVIYRDGDGNVVQSLDYVNETLVEIQVSGVENINSTSRFGFGFMWVPEDEDNYKDLGTPFYRNTFISNGPYDSAFSISATPDPTEYFGAGVNGGSMQVKDVHFREQSGNLVMSCVFTPNAEFNTIFDAISEDDRRYILWLSVASSSTSTRNFSNRVSLLADFSDLIKSIPAGGPYPMTTKFVEHPFVENQVGVDIYSGVTQDDVLVRSRFKIDESQDVEFIGMTFAIELENIETGEIFNLEFYDVDLSQSLIDTNGFQVFDVDEIRGFKLNDGNNKDFVKVEVDEDNSTDSSKAYVAYYGFKIRYEDWISKLNVPADFFDALQENDGSNNDWYDYINTPGSNWRLKFTNYVQANLEGEVVEYRTPHDFEFVDYDQNDLVATAVRYLRDSDNSLLNIGADPETGKPLGVILSNEPTRIEMDFAIQDSGTWINGNVYAVTTIEIDRGGGIFEMRQLSSIWLPESDNPLKPLDGETKLKLVISGSDKVLTTSCLVDPDLLEDAVRYRITGRVGCFDDNSLIDDGGIYETAYEQAYE